MVTIAHIVKKIILEKPFLHEALRRGIINHAALSEDLMPSIQKELGMKIKFSAVNMAIRRLSENLNQLPGETNPFDKSSHIVIRSDLISITLYKISPFQK